LLGPTDLLTWSSSLDSELSRLSFVGTKNETKDKKEEKLTVEEEELDSIEIKPNCSETRLTAIKNSKKYSQIKVG
jgi:hypothetical protein